jgi:hypothetical protein
MRREISVLARVGERLLNLDREHLAVNGHSLGRIARAAAVHLDTQGHSLVHRAMVGGLQPGHIGLQGCRAAGLQGCRAAGLQHERQQSRRARRRRCAGGASRGRQAAVRSGTYRPRAAGRPRACASSQRTAAADRAPAARRWCPYTHMQAVTVRVHAHDMHMHMHMCMHMSHVTCACACSHVHMCMCTCTCMCMCTCTSTAAEQCSKAGRAPGALAMQARALASLLARNSTREGYCHCCCCCRCCCWCWCRSRQWWSERRRCWHCFAPRHSPRRWRGRPRRWHDGRVWPRPPRAARAPA